MRRSPSSLAVLAFAACGPGHVFHKDPERGCADITLAGQEDVAAAAGCTAVESITLRTGMRLDLAPLGRLEKITGMLAVGPSVGLSELSLPRLRIAGAIKIVANGDLHGVFLPKLERVGDLEVEGNNSLSNLSAPKLAMVSGKLAIRDDPALEVVDLTALASAGEVVISNTPKLTLVEGALPALRSAIPASRPEVVTPAEP
ncbi:MAG: hypothetical protein H0V17_06370 [Deltaproteobacteria bacterium]|nr:hypothetical protein [Deltaproteobacteria bacterium]